MCGFPGPIAPRPVPCRVNRSGGCPPHGPGTGRHGRPSRPSASARRVRLAAGAPSGGAPAACERRPASAQRPSARQPQNRCPVPAAPPAARASASRSADGRQTRGTPAKRSPPRPGGTHPASGHRSRAGSRQAEPAAGGPASTGHRHADAVPVPGHVAPVRARATAAGDEGRNGPWGRGTQIGRATCRNVVTLSVRGARVQVSCCSSDRMAGWALTAASSSPS
jgi:hypothetical protein